MDKTSKLIKLYFRADICSSWGLAGKVKRVNGFMNYLTKKNLTPELKINPKVGGRREFFLYQTFPDGKEEQIIYSNSQILHPNAIKGEFSEEIYEELEQKLL